MDADQLLAAYAAAVAGRLGSNETTSTSQLRQYGERQFHPLQFLGVFPADVEPPRTRHRAFFVQNTQPSSEKGEHWTAIGREPGRGDLFFDSYGRKPGPGWMPHLTGVAITDPDLNQRLDSTRCGQISLGWGHVFLAHGYDVAQQC